MTAASTALSIADLHISIGRPLVHGISLDLHRGRVQGLAGESGSGKTLTSLACCREERRPPDPSVSATTSCSGCRAAP